MEKGNRTRSGIYNSQGMLEQKEITMKNKKINMQQIFFSLSDLSPYN